MPAPACHPANLATQACYACWHVKHRSIQSSSFSIHVILIPDSFNSLDCTPVADHCADVRSSNFLICMPPKGSACCCKHFEHPHEQNAQALRMFLMKGLMRLQGRGLINWQKNVKQTQPAAENDFGRVYTEQKACFPISLAPDVYSHDSPRMVLMHVSR